MDKTQTIKLIEDLINNGSNEEAFFLIKEYKTNIGMDEDILSIEAVLNIYSENYDAAMIAIRQGLKYNVNSSDLYYTMGNIFEIKGYFNRAYLCYEQALFLCKCIDNEEIIKDNIIKLKKDFNVKVNKSSIILLTYNQLEYTKICMDSFEKYVNMNSCEIIIVDNNSTDGTVEWIKEQKGVKAIFNKENKGFPAACNQGINISEKDNDILLLNNETVLMPNSIFNMRMALYSNKNIGATGAVSNRSAYSQKVNVDFDDYITYAINNNISDEIRYEEINKLVGFPMLIKREILEKTGYLDERFITGNYEDNDLSLTIILEGYKLLLCWDSYIHHLGSISFRKNASDICTEENIHDIKLKYLLRRIEFGIPYEECDLQLLNSKEYTNEIIIELIYSQIINKVMILNYIAIFFFNNNDYERVLPFLQEAYKINEKDNDTLYNLCYVLNFIGQKDLALYYANKITEKNSVVLELIDSIR